MERDEGKKMLDMLQKILREKKRKCEWEERKK